ncbi:D-glycero-beta-D-manno-heptose 1-phosphate adenylyltransferase [Thermomonospora umbrina]|uniref:D-glycero-beta-D-manno-heptose 1-phosphate adenylyltransferase n=1 Tax=Thermomonospora umbrina TaxID=111806 RepID=A0A3D9TBD7_9ACTN|nr:D-glycero-beta-D-manno-heptose 1-phosphate adenylyltransferase [Thermomonospora umbrina]REF01072.1 rfaE bifunctional protein kinase chain/domain/rfaE bifunctional protein nucleotidyltransferase chain/domain [Thermomonospora umbrina]
MRGGPLVVLGDALLDVDLEGAVERVSPDAPVPVVGGVREHRRAGGAGLAATLAAGLSARDVVLAAPIGGDAPGADLARLLAERVELLPLPLDGTTVRKTRVRAAGQSLVRVDQGDGRMAEALGGDRRERLRRTLRSAGAVLVADYGRGTAAHEEVRRMLAALPRDVPVVWDPHPRGAPPVHAARLVTPNQAEARAFADTPEAGGDPLARAAADAAVLVPRWKAAGVAVTLGERGALLSVGDDVPYVVTAPRTPGRVDACGAGDCFSAAAALALADGGLLGEAVTEAVRQAAAFVASGDPAVEPEPPADDPWHAVRRVRERGGTVVGTGGCFDLLHPGHVGLLRQARALGDLLVVCLNSDASVRSLKGPGRPVMPEQDRARVLAALDCVDAVLVFEEPTPAGLLERLRPDLWVKGADYASADLPEAHIVRRHGGQVVLLPYLEGRSTSRLVERARSRVHDGGEAA